MYQIESDKKTLLGCSPISESLREEHARAIGERSTTIDGGTSGWIRGTIRCLHDGSRRRRRGRQGSKERPPAAAVEWRGRRRPVGGRGRRRRVGGRRRCRLEGGKGRCGRLRDWEGPPEPPSRWGRGGRADRAGMAASPASGCWIRRRCRDRVGAPPNAERSGRRREWERHRRRRGWTATAAGREAVGGGSAVGR
jgi:hypothetical protein